MKESLFHKNQQNFFIWKKRYEESHLFLEVFLLQVEEKDLKSKKEYLSFLEQDLFNWKLPAL